MPHERTTADYNAIAWTGPTGATKHGIEKHRWHWPLKDRQVIATGLTFWEATARAEQARKDHENNECPF